MIKMNDKWSSLQEVVLGRSYYPEFYSSIKNNKIKSCLSRIADETEQDYSNFEHQLKTHGIKVHRPCLDVHDRIEHYVNDQGKITTSMQTVEGIKINTCESPDQFVSNCLIPRPPMFPRDSWAMVDGDIWLTSPDHPATTNLLEMIANDHGSNIIDCYHEFQCSSSGGNIFQIGTDMFLGFEHVNTLSCDLIRSKYPGLRWNFVNFIGHSDGVYHPIKPGAMISLHDMSMYEKSFPGWDILYLPNQSWHAVKPFLDLKTRNHGKWWLPGSEDNHEFTNFVETWLNNWVGYVEETVFDVNCLMIDEHNVFVGNYNKEVFDFLKKHNIEPHIVPFRHRYFWDGGLHCITLEIRRTGEIQDYFTVLS